MYKMNISKIKDLNKHFRYKTFELWTDNTTDDFFKTEHCIGLENYSHAIAFV